ncbi:hypothetical protein F4781DRAFT_431517 [Annulohypoxylon bovei var. microspora]|nr:hypothetical protein F4781DRAFT_431517 [Annulohypoxylon bovei var. microspora]
MPTMTWQERNRSPIYDGTINLSGTTLVNDSETSSEASYESHSPVPYGSTRRSGSYVRASDLMRDRHPQGIHSDSWRDRIAQYNDYRPARPRSRHRPSPGSIHDQPSTYSPHHQPSGSYHPPSTAGSRQQYSTPQHRPSPAGSLYPPVPHSQHQPSAYRWFSPYGPPPPSGPHHRPLVPGSPYEPSTSSPRSPPPRSRTYPLMYSPQGRASGSGANRAYGTGTQPGTRATIPPTAPRHRASASAANRGYSGVGGGDDGLAYPPPSRVHVRRAGEEGEEGMGPLWRRLETVTVGPRAGGRSYSPIRYVVREVPGRGGRRPSGY